MPSALAARFDAFDAQIAGNESRGTSLERFGATATGRDKPSRYWKTDIEALDIDALDAAPDRVTIAFANVPARVIATSLREAFAQHRQLIERAFGAALKPHHKWGHLGAAFAHDGAFVYVPQGVRADEIVLELHATGTSAFAYIVVLAESGATATIVERLRGDAAFAAVTVEVVAGESANVQYAYVQTLPGDSRVYATRVASPAKDATARFACADLGSSLSVGDVGVAMNAHGSQAEVAALFFPSQTQHVDIVSTVDHNVGDTTSETIVKVAASGAGQARYLGNIRIAAQAQNSNASLRDDALLLSRRAHIDSIPALEIAANEVKAFHGATVGAIDEEALFYMTSRGIERAAAERMIALGFFEPVIDRFPGDALRSELRDALQAKIEASAS